MTRTFHRYGLARATRNIVKQTSSKPLKSLFKPNIFGEKHMSPIFNNNKTVICGFPFTQTTFLNQKKIRSSCPTVNASNKC